MIEVDCEHLPGAVIVIRGELPRYSEFYDSLDRLVVPKGSILLKMSGLEFVRNLNIMVAECLDNNKMNWIWILGDDHSFGLGTLMQLLSHKVDCIIPLVSMRSFPFDTVIVENISGKRKSFKNIIDKNESKNKLKLNYNDRVGTAGMLIKTDILSKLSTPIFEVGKVFSDVISEDISFCKKLWEYSDVYVATDIVMDHITPMKLTPYRKQDGTFGVKITTLSGQIPWSIDAGV